MMRNQTPAQLITGGVWTHLQGVWHLNVPNRMPSIIFIYNSGDRWFVTNGVELDIQADTPIDRLREAMHQAEVIALCSRPI